VSGGWHMSGRLLEKQKTNIIDKSNRIEKTELCVTILELNWTISSVHKLYVTVWFLVRFLVCENSIQFGLVFCFFNSPHYKLVISSWFKKVQFGQNDKPAHRTFIPVQFGKNSEWFSLILPSYCNSSVRFSFWTEP
jgi:hypothetical protein